MIIVRSRAKDILMADEIITVTETKITIITKVTIRRNIAVVNTRHQGTEIDIIINHHQGDKVLF